MLVCLQMHCGCQYKCSQLDGCLKKKREREKDSPGGPKELVESQNFSFSLNKMISASELSESP